MNRPRLFIITPPALELAALVNSLKKAFEGGDIACVLIHMPHASARDLQTACEALVPIIQKNGAAALVHGDTQVAGRTGADGVHIDSSLEDVKLAVQSLQPAKIVGAGGTTTKHEDMEAAETGIDYLFYGKLDLEEKPEPHPKTLSQAQWWAELFETPCVALAGNTIQSVEAAAKTRAEFVAIKDALWLHSGGPADAVTLANRILEAHPLESAE